MGARLAGGWWCLVRNLVEEWAIVLIVFWPVVTSWIVRLLQGKCLALRAVDPAQFSPASDRNDIRERLQPSSGRNPTPPS